MGRKPRPLNPSSRALDGRGGFGDFRLGERLRAGDNSGMKRSPFTLFLLAFLSFLPSACHEKETLAGGGPAPEAPPVIEKGENAASDEAFIGRTANAAAALAKEQGLLSRVVSVDGQLRPTTKDYRPNRVNFEIEKGKVVKVSRG